MKQLLEKRNRLIIGFITLLLTFLGLFEFLPIVQEAREMFPKEFNHNYSCNDILENRLWYGKINPWIWFWLTSTPALVFLIKPNALVWIKVLSVAFITAISYVFINIGTYMYFKIKNSPFYDSEITPNSSDVEIFKSNCFDFADGGLLAFSLVLGWIPASLYVGFCFMVRWLFCKIWALIKKCDL